MHAVHIYGIALTTKDLREKPSQIDVAACDMKI